MKILQIKPADLLSTDKTFADTKYQVGLRKLSVWVVSMILAYIIGQGLFPTQNVVGGGAASMFIFIFLTVIFRATIEYLLSKWKRKN